MFDKKKALPCAIIFYVLAVLFIVLYIVMAVVLKKNIIPLVAVAVPMFLIAGIVMTVIYVRFRQKQAPLHREFERANKLAAKYNRGNPSGFEVIMTNRGEFVFVGSFDFGELGVMKGKNVRLDFGEKDLNGLSKDDLIKFARDVAERTQKNLTENSHNLKNYFLLNMLFDAYDLENEAWQYYRKCEDKYTDEQCAEIFNSVMESEFHSVDKLSEQLSRYDEKGLAAKYDLDIERFIKDKLEFFNIDKLINCLDLEAIHIDKNGAFSLQISDKTQNIFCCAYVEVDTDLTMQEWHNL